MNTIDYLFKLEAQNTFFKNGINDLKVLLNEYDNLSKEVLEKEFTSFCGLTKETFLEKIKEDLFNSSLEKVIKITEIIAKDNNIIGSALTKTIRESIYEYAIIHPEFDYLKYNKVIALGIIADMSNDLYSPIYTSFDDVKNQKASTDTYYNATNNTHQISINLKNITAKSREEYLTDMAKTIYHEKYHALVQEMIINPDCYKLDILEYAKVKAYRNAKLNDSFYDENYLLIHEEAAAEIYGTHLAYKRLQEINPNFKIPVTQKIASEYSIALESQYATKFKTGFLKRVSQEQFLNQEIDKIFKQNPKNIYGILTKLYNSDGTRKNFKTLINGYNNIKENNKRIPEEEIDAFYGEICYDILTDEEIKNNSDLKDEIMFMLNNKSKNLTKKLVMMENEKNISFFSQIKKSLMKKEILKKIKEVNNKKEIVLERKNGYGL